MHPRLKHIALQLLPPILATAIKRVLNRRPCGAETADATPGWELVADRAELWTGCHGWSHASIVETQREKWADFLVSVEGARPLGQSHEAAAGSAAEVGAHNTIMTFGYALGRAAFARRRLSILDWGGGMGHYFVYARKLFPELELDYVIKDLPALCDAGRQLLPEAVFVSDEEQALARQYDLVFASSSLHYVRNCYGLLDRICACAARWLMITRMPFVETHDDFVVVQRPHMYGYMTEYPGWFLNRRRVTDFVRKRGFALDREFLVAECPDVPGAPEPGQYRGFLFRRTDH